ncbi:MAG: YIP1 family protein [Candidatus Gastranaerophilales bacterium]|nr:YIP1 family protein [Candidatus Gastranaerophilales bacterium]
MNDFLDNIYGVLFSPKETFDKLILNSPVLQGFIIVIFISIIGPLTNFEFCGSLKCLFLLGFKIFSSAFAGVISWFFFASFLEILASVFKQAGKIKEFLTLSAFALIPWIFIAPVGLFKSAGILGIIFGILLGLGIWLWVTALVILAVIKTYNLSIGRTVVLLTLPFFAGFLAFNWIIGFFVTLFNILRV